MTVSNLALAEVCAGTYQPGATPQWQDSVKLTHVYLQVVDGIHTIAWEGTTDWQEWLFSDFAALAVPVFSHPQLGPVHAGMVRDVLSVKDAISAYLASIGWPPYYNTGHSKGAGEALLFHGLMLGDGHPPLCTRAYEAPRVGSWILKDYLAKEDIEQTQTKNVHGADIVTLVPPALVASEWCDVRTPIALTVPDDYSIAQKHRIPAVIEALQRLEDLNKFKAALNQPKPMNVALMGQGQN
jgi:hypothetical protein